MKDALKSIIMIKNSKHILIIIFAAYLLPFPTVSINAQSDDWRNVKNGFPVYSYGYCDQPYVVVLNNRKWLCVFTTNAGREGSKGQHIVSCTSDDQGMSWSVPVKIEEPGKESASWAMPYLTDYGRVYVFYNYNGDKIHELNGNNDIREDMLGWYCYKYTEDEGRTWSKRYRLNVPKTAVDLHNDWKGEVQIMWGIGKPVDVDSGMMFAFTKIGKYMLNDSEGWFFRCDNINSEKDPEKLKWVMLPESQNGLKNEVLGPVNAEQNIFQMQNGNIYCMYRTISGHPAESYSYDGGRSWTTPGIPKYESGIELKTPRACPRIWKCKNGKYLFWYHNNGGWNFNSRNPAWISGGIERNGKIVWSQPEILFYEDEIKARMSYPDLIEQDGKYWITETNKEIARCHAIPVDFFNMIWSQFDRESISTEGLVKEWPQQDLKPETKLHLLSENQYDFRRGFTFDFRLELGDLAPNQKILSVKSKSGKQIELRTSEYGSVEIRLSDGTHSDSWNSDPGLIKAFGEHCISVVVDNGPHIIQFIVDGIVCNGRDFRQYGWGRFNLNVEDIDFDEIEIGELKAGQLRPHGRLTNLRIYNRPLMNTELIGNHRNFKSQLFSKAEFIVEPEIFIHHTAERDFIGPGTILLDDGDILMAAPWGRPPTNFGQLAAEFPVPMLYRSTDGGRTWKEEGYMKMSWNLSGMISDGGISFLRLKDGRLAFVAHRHVKGLDGGGLPSMSFSSDNGKNWTPAKLVGNTEGVWYVMNDRLIQMSNGRIIVPVSHMPKGLGSYEGDHNPGLCFFSDDGGKTWKKSQKPADLNDGRGMAEPCVAEIGNNQLLMLARTGSGSLFRSLSNDGGDTWSTPEPTSLVAACSPLTLKTLPDGRLIVFYNHAKPFNKGAFFPRTPLVYAVSPDKGKTWGKPVIVDDDGMKNNDRMNIYPSACFTKEGMLVIWSTHVAAPGGSFSNGGSEGWKTGGGKRAILAYPN